MQKIAMPNPIVEMDGDEMTRIIWDMVKTRLLSPFIDLNTAYYDLGLKNRDNTEDQVTLDAAAAIKKYGVGVKCATITPNAQRVSEYGLKKMWKSPNGTIRAALDGTVFRMPILVRGIEPFVRTWNKPITIARHAYGDIYKDTEMIAKPNAKAKLVLSYGNKVSEEEIFSFDEEGGIVLAMYNTEKSIKNFAKTCFSYALSTKQDLWFATKDTISKTYDHRFKDIFSEMYENEFKEKFKNAGIEYFYTLIDDAVARVIRSNGGFVWALKNYDGDVMSDMMATAYGSLAMMTSVLVSPDGNYEYEAAHGTVTRHYYKHIKGEETSTNSVATIFAWTGAIKKRGELDGSKELIDFSNAVEKACIDTIQKGIMTKDLSIMSTLPNIRTVSTAQFIDEIAKELKENI